MLSHVDRQLQARCETNAQAIDTSFTAEKKVSACIHHGVFYEKRLISYS